jgi:pseudouridine synthase
MTAPGKVPLARALSKLGVASRVEATALIRDGRVAVDGHIVLSPQQMVVPERVALEIDGRPVARPQLLTILLHKPRGVVTTRHDPQGRPTVLDLVADAPVRVFPVGRLDMASTGLLLLTNDSRFADWVTDPANHVPRTYVVTVRGELGDDVRARLEAGIEVGGEHLTAARIDVRKRSRRETHLVVELTEGKNREIRRLFEEGGHEVTRLKRVAFGGLALGRLAPGTWRAVSKAELGLAFPNAPVSRMRDSHSG